MENIKKSTGLIDPLLYVKSADNETLDPDFICLICQSVAKDPKMCKECDKLYC